jgi:hypothetical protein
MKTKTTILCPVCRKNMRLGKVEGKVLAMCENKKCETTVVFGDHVQKAFSKI